MNVMRHILKFSANKILKSRTVASDQEGFTLLEVIIAMAIMVIAFTSILTVESGSLNASARAKQMNIVAMLAKNKMVETEYEIEGKTFDEVSKESSGSFDPPYQDFSWQTTIKEVTFPNLALGQGSPEGGKSSNSQDSAGSEMVTMMTKLVTKFFSKSIREVTVNISWKRGSGEQRYSVSTYWVDLNHEFELSE